jgi:hypothetical protein
MGQKFLKMGVLGGFSGEKIIQIIELFHDTYGYR